MLVIIQLIVMMGVYMLQSSILAKKMSIIYWKHNVLFINANQQLKLLEKDDLSDFCNIDVITQSDLLSQSFDWWQSHACIEKTSNFTYYYVIETLNNTTCTVVNNILVPINYSRITLLAYSENKVFRELLQSVVVKLDNAKRDCTNDYAIVHLGRQSWRRI